MRILYILTFALIYLREVVLSTWRLVVLVVQPTPQLRPTFVEVPLDLKSEFSQFLFACLISMTPGTLSVSLDRERRILLVHVLDSEDPDNSIQELKNNFEAPLLRIFREG